MLLPFLDIFFLVFHSVLILFNLFGWMWRRTAPWNLLTLVVTGLSWSLLGIWYGWGYCFCTDWHWEVLRKMGEEDLPFSYVKYLLMRLFSVDLNPLFVDGAVLGFYVQALLVSLWVNLVFSKARWGS